MEFWGEGKSYLRKQDPIFDTYHSLPLRERTARLLQTSVIPTSTTPATPKVVDASIIKSLESGSSWN